MPRTKKNDKRNRLVAAANALIFKNGFNITTLADIAKEANVPLGNVYYYFKTKDSILESVIQERASCYRELFNTWNELESPAARLIALINQHLEQAETTARYGCTLGGLCQELGKIGGAIGATSASLMVDILKWVETQFKELGREADAQEAAEQLIANIQGLSLLTLAFKDPTLIRRQSRMLIKELEAMEEPVEA